MAIGNKFNVFVADRNNGKHNLSSDELRAMLTNQAPSADDAVFSDIVEIAPGGGYEAGGKAVQIASSSQVGGAYSLVPGADPTWFATGPVDEFRYVVLYNNTSATKPLISWYDYGSGVSLVSPDKFILDVGSTLMTGL